MWVSLEGHLLLNEDTGYPCPVKFKFQINNKYEFHKKHTPRIARAINTYTLKRYSNLIGHPIFLFAKFVKLKG